MVECVVHKRLRSAFKDNWKSHPVRNVLKIVECCITWQCRDDDETTVTMLLP